MEFNKLTPEEERVIVHKGTERSFTGEYNDNKETGTWQGPDFGTQYRSAIFYLSDEQKEIAEKLIQILKDNGHKVVTEVTKATTFWKAEDKHQQYYTSGGGSPYCHSYTKNF